MRYMNGYEILDSAEHYERHPVLGPATRTLLSLYNWTNRNSDGWAYWPKPVRAAAKLMDLIEGADPRCRYDYRRDDATVEQFIAALKPIKSFRTRQHADFKIYENLEDVHAGNT
jgi:hypothetical protein